MQFLTRLLPSFFVGWLVTFTLASMLHSHYIVNRLMDIGVTVPLIDRVMMMLYDWFGLLPTYGVIIAISDVIAFLVAGGVYKLLGKYGVPLFVFAGIAALMVVLLVIKSILNINVIAGARGWGFYAQVVSGAFGAYVFAKMMKLEVVKS